MLTNMVVRDDHVRLLGTESVSNLASVSSRLSREDLWLYARSTASGYPQTR